VINGVKWIMGKGGAEVNVYLLAQISSSQKSTEHKSSAANLEYQEGFWKRKILSTRLLLREWVIVLLDKLVISVLLSHSREWGPNVRG
jgi:hypothetical protein